MSAIADVNKSQRTYDARKMLLLGHRSTNVSIYSGLSDQNVRQIRDGLRVAGYEVRQQSGPAPSLSKIISTRLKRIEANILVTVYSDLVAGEFHDLTLRELEKLHQAYSLYLRYRQDAGITTSPIPMDHAYILVAALRINGDSGAYLHKCPDCSSVNYIAIEQHFLNSCVYCSIENDHNFMCGDDTNQEGDAELQQVLI